MVEPAGKRGFVCLYVGFRLRKKKEKAHSPSTSLAFSSHWALKPPLSPSGLKKSGAGDTGLKGNGGMWMGGRGGGAKDAV